VPFEVVPAIDVAGGRLVSVSGGRPRPVAAFGGSPLAAAQAFVEAGATWLHVVDVDRAEGRQPDLALVSRLAALGARIQASGAVESPSAARAALDAGAARVVLGSALLADASALRDLVEDLGGRAVVGIEAEGRVIRPRSARSTTLPLLETLEALRSLGPALYLYTGLAHVAGMAGPDLAGIATAARILGRPVLAAGGVRGVEDVVAVRDLGSELAAGVVVGRALYAGVELGGILAAV
jgi:phosphoribosylformimino-5-aminoimidazole carboxamide ribonucleotide (ProFAR) isomerase